MLILISYSPEGRVNTSCHCHPEYDTWDSFFRINSFGNEEELIDTIFSQWKEDHRRAFKHIVLTEENLKNQILHAGSYYGNEGHSIEYSIEVSPKTDDEDGWNEAHQETDRLRNILVGRINNYKSKK